MLSSFIYFSVVQLLSQSIFPVGLLRFISHTKSPSNDIMTQELNAEMSERKRKSHFYFCIQTCGLLKVTELC